MKSIDLNVDVGEGAGNDHELLSYVTSANIACGVHAGSADTMRRVAARALELGVVIGAHPGHADREFYGRREIAITPRQAERLISDQVHSLERVVESLGGRVRYLKPHGALYHQLARELPLAESAVRVALRRDPPLLLLGPSDSQLAVAAEQAGIPFFCEAFADRAYLSSGGLAPRHMPEALLDDEREVVRQAANLATNEFVDTLDGGKIKVCCDSLCLHSDSPWAVEFAAGVALMLAQRGVQLSPFVGVGS